MKITVDGNIVTIDYDKKSNDDNIVEECIETLKKPVTYRDEFLKFCKAILEKELKIYSQHESSFFVYNGASFYHVGFDNGYALRQFADKYKHPLDWENPDTIIKWLDSEIEGE